MDRFKAMQTFVQIADQGSLTRAADALGSSLPAVVRSLAALEAHLGVRLFQRTTRRLSLTEEGRHYLASAREVLLAAEAADRALKTEAREPAGHLTITAPVLFGHMYVAPAITRFMQRHEKVRCSVLLHDRTVNLLEEGIDVGIRISPLEDSSLVAQPLGTIRRVVAASPAFLQRHGVPRHPRDLAGAPCVRGRLDAPTQWTFREGGKRIGVTPDNRLAFNHLAPAVEACAAGMGFGSFFSYQVLSHVDQGRLQLVLEDFEPPPRPVSVIYPNARLLPARTRAFIDWMKAEFDGFRL
ncbi:DNA-binding transcriptional LysR family regulator [Variovorax sp. TBS-050B]|uniref:LysR family transcriptional regulator n=1 Tax=Variovorax sp. TBS-050B TaxID=2940551 RepID=UPI0024734059|nr:LysR family transcriptional regulator [Variovorax sp. TBS-050B]MDH6591730.1 DNA-binding transcriptional LysR family regulator [Variovorax sp. TBS-050B]